MWYHPWFIYRVIAVLTLNGLGHLIMQGVDCCEQGNPSLYFMDDHNIKCVEFGSLRQSNPTTHTVVSSIAEGTAIDIDVRNNIVYWSDTHAWTINKKNLTSGEVKVILKENIGQVFSLAFEWESGLIYWTDYLYERIEVAKTDGSSRRTLVTQNVKSPIGIAVHPLEGYLVWSDYDYSQRKIMRADLTGENQRVLLRLFYTVPYYLTIDYAESRVYWAGFQYTFPLIGFVGLDGRNFGVIRYLSQAFFPLHLTVFQNDLYWADGYRQGIAWFDFKDSNSPVTTRDGLTRYSLVGVATSDPSRQQIAGRGPCAENNGNCSDLCLPTPGRERKCACSQGITLSSDGLTCNNASTAATQSPPLPAIEVHLAGSAFPNQGRVEVKYNGQWGTICDDYWGISEAHVICRMLNYSGAEFAPREAYFGPGRSSYPIWLDTVKCRGDESTIAACRHDGWSNHDCQHREDASVVCWSESAPAGQEPTLAPGPHPELEIRLYGGDTHYEGGVEIKLNGTWGTICDDSWGIEEANVICRMLNFTEGALSTQCCGFYNGYGIAERIWLDDVHCDGSEHSIAECRHGGWGSHNCRHTEDVGVVCKHSPISAPDQIVRLVDGARESEGRVEVFRDSHWGTVCDDHWDINDADVLCRMLNYSRAVRAPGHAFFGRGNGRIWLSNVKCLGNEASLLQCGHQTWDINNCGHHEDASVICQQRPAHLESKNFILVCESGRSLIYHISLDSSGLPEKGVPLAIQTHNPQAITFNNEDNMVYWTEQSGSIVRSYLNGSSREVIVTGLTFPIGLAIDHVGQNLYFTNQSGIMVSKLDGSYQSHLIKSVFARGIALDSDAGHIYFTSTGINPKIQRADMDGKNIIVLMNVSSVRETTLDIALDKFNKRLYYSDSRNNLVKYIDLANLTLHPVLSDRPHGPVGLTSFKSTLYWTGGESQTYSGAVYKADADNVNGSSVRKVMDLLSLPKGLYAHDSGTLERSGNHSCAKGNGECSHLCVINPGGYRCLCPILINEPCQESSTSIPTTTVYISSPGSTEIGISASVSRSPTLKSSTVHPTKQPSLSSSTGALSLSSSSSVATPKGSIKTSSASSNTRSSTSSLAPSTPSTVVSTLSSISSITGVCSISNPCENGGRCTVDDFSYKCVCAGYFAGRHCSIGIRTIVVVIVIEIQENKFDKTVLIQIVVESLNNLCEGETNSCPIQLLEGQRRRKRALRVKNFTPDDVIIPVEPKQVGANLHVELAVLKISADGSASVVSSEKLSKIIIQAAGNISQLLGGRLVSAKLKLQAQSIIQLHSKTATMVTTLPPTQTSTTSTSILSLPTITRKPPSPGRAAVSTGGSNGGVIGGAVVAVFVVVLIIAFLVWYFRVRTTLPYKKDIDAPTTRTASFANPGYDNAAGFGTADSVIYEDISPIVPLPYQEMNDFGAVSNPMYTSTVQENVSSTDGNRSRKFDAYNANFGLKPGIPAVSGNKTRQEQESKMSFEASIRQEPAVLVLENSDRPGNNNSEI